MSNKELRGEYIRAKSVYLKDPSADNAMYLEHLAKELDKRAGNVRGNENEGEEENEDLY